MSINNLNNSENLDLLKKILVTKEKIFRKNYERIQKNKNSSLKDVKKLYKLHFKQESNDKIKELNGFNDILLHLNKLKALEKNDKEKIKKISNDMKQITREIQNINKN